MVAVAYWPPVDNANPFVAPAMSRHCADTGIVPTVHDTPSLPYKTSVPLADENAQKNPAAYEILSQLTGSVDVPHVVPSVVYRAVVPFTPTATVPLLARSENTSMVGMAYGSAFVAELPKAFCVHDTPSELVQMYGM
jgi:hypothetical protein